MFGLGYQELLLILILLIPVGLAWYSFRLRKKYPIEHGARIGGWLILVGVGVVLTQFFLAWATSEALKGPDGQVQVPTAIVVVIGVILVIWSIYNAVLFFRRHRFFPSAWIGLHVTLIVAGGILGTYDRRGFWWSVSWIGYMLRSLRVKNTFVR